MIKQAISNQIRSFAPRLVKSAHWQILKTAGIVGIASILVKVLMAGRDVASASIFGRSDQMDAFVIAYTVPMAIITLLSGSLNAALIPTFVEVDRNKGPVECQRLMSNVTLFSSFVMLVACCLFGLASAPMMSLIAPHFGPQKLHLTVLLFNLMLPMIFFTGLSMTWISVLNARNSFLWPTLVPGISSILGIVATFAMGHHMGVRSLAVALSIGTGFELIAAGMLLSRRGIRIEAKWYGRSPEFMVVVREWGPVIGFGVFIAGIRFVDQSMASMLSAGSAAALSYGTKVVVFVGAMVTVPMATTVMPHFSRLTAAKDYRTCRRHLLLYSGVLLVMLVPVSGILFFWSKPLVRIIYQHGVFGGADTEIVAKVQAMYALQIPFYVINMMYMRFLSAMKRNKLIMYGGALNLALDIIFNLLFMRVWGISGIALSTSAFWAASCIFLAIVSAISLSKAIAQTDIAAAAVTELQSGQPVA